MALLSHGVAPPLDGRGVSLVDRPVLEIRIIKGLSEISAENKMVALYGGASRGDSSPFGPHLKTSLANVFPVDCELCFFFHVVLFRRPKVYSINAGAAAEGVAPTLNALHPLFNVRKIAYSPFFPEV